MTVRVLQNRSIFGSVDPSIVANAARSRFENRARAFCVRLSSCQSKWHLSACLMLLLSVQERTQPHQMNKKCKKKSSALLPVLAPGPTPAPTPTPTRPRPDSVGCWEFRKICIYNSRQMRMQMQIPWKSHIVYRLQAEIKLMLIFVIFAFTFFGLLAKCNFCLCMSVRVCVPASQGVVTFVIRFRGRVSNAFAISLPKSPHPFLGN